MSLKYSLVENLLTERPDDYSALVQTKGSLDKEALIRRILRRGTTLTRTDVLAVMNELEAVVEDVVQDGYNITYPLFNISFSISGVFEGAMDAFDGNRHKLNINLTKGLLLRNIEKQIKLVKTESHAPHPSIMEVKDCVSGLVNEILTAPGVVEVRGYNLKIEGDDPACGLWFVAENGVQTRAVTIIENKPSRIMAMIPALQPGKYQVKVATQYMSNNKFLKTPKVVVYPKNLTVANQ
jgi:hypothetical protein